MKDIISDSQSRGADASGTTKSECSAALLHVQHFSVCAPFGMELAIQLVTFDGERFRVEDFASSGIMCPAGITRSVRKRQAEFYFGRLAARNALNTLNIRAGDVLVGKMREPVWPAGIVGSISHTQKYAAAGVSRCDACSGIGIDLEHVAGKDACNALSTMAVDDGELQYLKTLVGALSMSVLLTLAFSAKESFFKGAFGKVGKYFGFDAARILRIDLVRGVILLELVETLCAAFVRHQVCEVGFCFIESDVVLTHFIW